MLNDGKRKKGKGKGRSFPPDKNRKRGDFTAINFNIKCPNMLSMGPDSTMVTVSRMIPKAAPGKITECRAKVNLWSLLGSAKQKQKISRIRLFLPPVLKI